MTAALRLLVAGLACLALVAPQAAAAQGRAPSASELRDTYPLHSGSEPRPDRAATPTAAPARDPAGQAVASSDRTAMQLVLLALLSLLAFAAGFALSVRPRRERRAPPQPPPAAARPAAPARRADPPLLSASDPPRALPPATRRPWTAQIAWREVDGEPRFCVVARTERGAGDVTLMTSRPLEWPPAGPEAVQALRDAAEALEVSLLAAGWTALPRGEAWYEKRFAWRPADPAPESDRFRQTPAGLSSA